MFTFVLKSDLVQFNLSYYKHVCDKKTNQNAVSGIFDEHQTV
jgi:hypothetical protein